MRRLFYFIGLFICIIGFFVVKIYTFDHQQLVAEYLAKLSGNRFLITTEHISSIKISSSPYIKIRNIKIIDKEISESNNQIFDILDAQVRFNFFDIILGRKSVAHLKLNTPILNILSPKVIQNYIDYIQNENVVIDRISITNGQICDIVTKNCNMFIPQFDLEFNYKKLLSTLNIKWGNSPENQYNLVAKLKENSEISASINGQSAKFVLIGKYENNNILGSVEGEIFNSRLFVESVLKPLSLPNNFSILDNKESIKVNTQISLGLDKFELNDIKISSANISGTGKISSLGTETAKVEMNLSKVILIDNSDNANDQDIKRIVKKNDLLGDKNFLSLPNLKDVKTIISFKELIIGDKQFKDFIIDYKVKDKLIYDANASGMYNDIKFTLKDSNFDPINKILISNLNLEGKNLDSLLNLFLDKNTLEYKDKEELFNLSSTLKISPTGIDFNNVILSINNSSITSNISKIFGEVVEYKLDINFDNFDFNKVSSTNFSNAIRYFVLNTNENAYLAKFKVLRELKDKIDLNMKISNSLIGDLFINEMISHVLVAKGQLNIDEFKINSDFAKIDKLKFLLDSRVINPNVNIELKSEKLDLDRIISKFSVVEKATLHSKSNEIIDSEVLEQEKTIWSNKKINLFRFDKFTGVINLDISDININSHNIDNITLSSAIKDESLLLDPLIFKWKNSDTNVKGAITQDYDQVTISINFVANNVDLSSVSDFVGVKKVKGGKVNFTGNLYTAGNNQFALLNNLQLTIPFSARDLELNGFNLQNLILNAADKKFNSESEIKDFLNKSLELDTLMISKVQGYLRVKDGLMESQNVNFEAPYSLGVFGGILDLNKMILKSQSNITFSLEQNKPIVLAISNYGNLKDFNSLINTNSLEDYLKTKVIHNLSDSNEDIAH